MEALTGWKSCLIEEEKERMEDGFARRTDATGRISWHEYSVLLPSTTEDLSCAMVLRTSLVSAEITESMMEKQHEVTIDALADSGTWRKPRSTRTSALWWLLSYP